MDVSLVELALDVEKACSNGKPSKQEKCPLCGLLRHCFLVRMWRMRPIYLGRLIRPINGLLQKQSVVKARATFQLFGLAGCLTFS
jgi:hypothetical protein